MINPTSMRTREVWTLPIDQIEPNTFNPNTMTKETYNALLEDIKENGLDIVNPILVSEKAVFYGTKDSGFVIMSLLQGAICRRVYYPHPVAFKCWNYRTRSCTKGFNSLRNPQYNIISTI